MSDKKQQLPALKTDTEEQATGAIYQVIKDFTARLEDELSLKIGDKVEVISDDKEYNDGWYMGKSLASGSVGLYPKSFTQLLPSLSRPSILRSRSRRIASPSTSTNSPLSMKSTTPVSTKASKLDFETPPSKTIKSEFDDDNNNINGALSDIDKALEELKNDVQPRFDESTYSNGSTESLNPEFVETWSPEQVTSYFKYLGFDNHSSQQFLKHKITGQILLELELAYLKELDISSFGTRFEIFKEIEALKDLVQNKNASHTFDEKDEIDTSSQSLLAAAELHKDIAPLGLSKKSLDNISEKSPKIPQLNLPLKNNIPPSSQVPKLPQSSNNNITEQFLSPRRAPQPPSYPSPIQLNSAQNTPVTNKRNSYYESVGHSRKPSYDINPTFQSRTNHSRKSSYEPLHSRNNSKNFKSQSVADLLSHSENNRPASSVYMHSISHSRHSSVNLHTRQNSEITNKEEKKHRRHSSVFSFLSVYNSPSPFDNDSKRRSVSAKEAKRISSQLDSPINNENISSPKRSVSEAFKNKTLRSISSSTTLKKNNNNNNKKGTSAFMEGIRNTGPQESMKTADCYGWMNKRGGIAVGVWKQRYFTLHGTRLSYFTSLTDNRERGLIDITSHKVLPAKEDDKLVSLYAATTGHGKFCFKLVPPAPGSKKGLTFTQPKVHYFAVETKEEMRTWMAALIKATIDIDESVPVLSSCATPTVSLQKAQSLLAQARENARRREEVRNLENLNKPDISGTSSISPDTDSYDSNLPATNNNTLQSPNTTVHTSDLLTPVLDNASNGFASPFEIASNNFVTPKSSVSATISPVVGSAEFKSKPYSSLIKTPSQRVMSNSAATAAAALSLSNSYSDRSKDNRI